MDERRKIHPTNTETDVTYRKATLHTKSMFVKNSTINYTNKLFKYKNKLYKNTKAEIYPKIRNKLITTPC